MKVQFVCVFFMATMVATLSGKVLSERDRYIIMLKDGATDEHIESLVQLVEEHEGLPRKELFIKSTNSLLPMFYGNMREETANKISRKKIVDLVEKDQVVTIEKPFHGSNGVSIENLVKKFYNTSTSRYNLDIIDDATCTDGRYTPFDLGWLADIYIIDTGINYDHEDFGWADGYPVSRAKFGYDAVDTATGSTQRGRDCQGHGTHCAGIAGGLYSGVAKEALLTSIRVGDCFGYANTSLVMDGLDEASKLHQKMENENAYFFGSIISMSFIFPKSTALERAVNACVAKGMVAVTSSGNSAVDACNKSPGSTGTNIIVGAHGYEASDCKKPIAYFSNYGTCVDIVAPGIDILSASYKSNKGYTTKSGTSMACPHVAGVAAIMKSRKRRLTPAQIKESIKANGINDIDRSSLTPGQRAISKANRLYITPNLVT